MMSHRDYTRQTGRASRIYFLRLALRLLFALSGVCVARGQIIWDFPQTVAIGEPDIALTVTLRPVASLYQAPNVLAPLWVLPGTKVRLQLGPYAKPGVAYEWHRGSVQLNNAGTVLDLGSVSSADSGTYIARAPTDPTALHSTIMAEPITLRVGQPAKRTLANVSMLVRLSAAQPVATTGFTIAPGIDGVGTVVLVRAVGPSLSRWVSDPLAAPRIRIFDANGIETGATAVALDGGDPATSMAQRVGAFAIPAGTKDVARVVSLAPGPYTAQVSAVDGGNGTVLVEVYEEASSQ